MAQVRGRPPPGIMGPPPGLETDEDHNKAKPPPSAPVITSTTTAAVAVPARAEAAATEDNDDGEDAGESTPISESPKRPIQTQTVKPKSNRKDRGISVQLASTAGASPSTAPPPSPGLRSANARECLICCKPIDIFGLGVCNHRDVCGLCVLRLREKYHDKQCTLCKAELEQMIFTKHPERPFAEYDLKRCLVDRKSGVFCDSESVRNTVEEYYQFRCAECDRTGASTPMRNSYRSYQDLRTHLNSGAHPMKYKTCDTCALTGKKFPFEIEIFPSKQALEDHKTRGDGTAFKGHSMCAFCRHWYLDDDVLYEHMTKNHELCKLCEETGVQHQYYQNSDSLSAHMKQDHYACEESECLAAKVVAFSTHEGLKQHMLTVHRSTMSQTDRKRNQRIDIEINFASQPAPQRMERQPRGAGRGQGSRRGRVEQTGKVSLGRFDTDEIEAAMAASSLETTSTTASAAAPAAAADEPSREELVKRNRAVVAALKSALGSDVKFQDFQTISLQFRQEAITARKYYEESRLLLGERTDELLPELIALLPDEKKRSELRAAQGAHHDEATRRAESYPELETSPTATTTTAAASKGKKNNQAARRAAKKGGVAMQEPAWGGKAHASEDTFECLMCGLVVAKKNKARHYDGECNPNHAQPVATQDTRGELWKGAATPRALDEPRTGEGEKGGGGGGGWGAAATQNSAASAEDFPSLLGAAPPPRGNSRSPAPAPAAPVDDFPTLGSTAGGRGGYDDDEGDDDSPTAPPLAGAGRGKKTKKKKTVIFRVG